MVENALLVMSGVRPVIAIFVRIIMVMISRHTILVIITILFAAAGQLWLVNPSTVNISKQC